MKEKNKSLTIEPAAPEKSVNVDLLPTPIIVIDREYNVEYINRNGLEKLGIGIDEAVCRKCYDLMKTDHCRTDECRVKQAIEKDTICTGRTTANGLENGCFVQYTAAPLKNGNNRIIGAVEYLVDITEMIESKKKAEKLAADIMELSTPILSLWEGILVVPIIGTLDSRRTQQMMEKALTRISEEKSRVLIVDITGVPVIDTMVANHLIQMATAVRLMGSTCILTGISPATAKTIVHLGIDLHNITTRGSLAQGLNQALELIDKSGGNNGNYTHT